MVRHNYMKMSYPRYTDAYLYVGLRCDDLVDSRHDSVLSTEGDHRVAIVHSLLSVLDCK